MAEIETVAVNAGSASPDEAFAERLRAFVGTASDEDAYDVVVDVTVVRLLTESIGDRNPVYCDPQAAARSPHGAVVAPATMLMCWTVQARPLPMHARDADGRAVFRLENARPVSEAALAATRAEEARTGEARPGLRTTLLAAGFVAPAVTNGWFEYKRYLRPGETVTVGPVHIDQVIGPKKTSLGTGFFITQRQHVTDASGEEVAVVRMTMLSSRPDAKPANEAGASEAGDTPRPTRPAPRAEFSPAAIWATPAEAWAPALDSVAVGEALPELVVELTPTQIIQGALASQDWAPVHHDRDIARKFGHPDVFMNIQTSTGLVGRLVTDWAGADAVIETLDIRLGVPAYAYDKLTMTGEVTQAEPAGNGRARVSVAVKALNSLGAHITSNVTFTVPAAIRG